MTRATRRMTAIATVAGPALMLISTVAYIANGRGMSEGEVAGTIQIWAFAAFGVALVGLARLLETDAPRAASWVTAIGVLGVAGGAAYGMDSIVAGAFHVSAQDIGRSVTPLALRLPGLAFPVALVALGALLARYRLVPAAAAGVLVLAALLFPASRIPDVAVIAVASDVLALVALAVVARSITASPVGTAETIGTAGTAGTIGSTGSAHGGTAVVGRG